MKPTRFGSLLNYIHVAYSLAVRGEWQQLDMFLRTGHALLTTEAPVVTIDIIAGPAEPKG